MIGVRGLGHRYGFHWVLRGIDLTVAPGTCLALFGANGAGKTTLMRIMAGMMQPSEGALLWQGEALAERDERHYRRQVGYLGHDLLLYPDLSADENLRFFAGLYGIPSPEARIDALLQRVGLSLFRRDPICTYSEGMRRRLALARALLHEPTVLILDEPDAAMDVAAKALVAEIVASCRASGGMVVLATHDLAAGLRRADRHVVLRRGRVVARGEAGPDAVQTVQAQLVGGEGP